MNIPKPIGGLGERVQVFNYKRKPKGQKGVWETAIIESMSYHINERSKGWSYSVILDRRKEIPVKNRWTDGPETFPIKMNFSETSVAAY